VSNQEHSRRGDGNVFACKCVILSFLVITSYKHIEIVYCVFHGVNFCAFRVYEMDDTNRENETVDRFMFRHSAASVYVVITLLSCC